jgi:hypothetical protein
MADLPPRRKNTSNLLDLNQMAGSAALDAEPEQLVALGAAPEFLLLGFGLAGTQRHD